jgi:hypothetical protein
VVRDIYFIKKPQSKRRINEIELQTGHPDR